MGRHVKKSKIRQIIFPDGKSVMRGKVHRQMMQTPTEDETYVFTNEDMELLEKKEAKLQDSSYNPFTDRSDVAFRIVDKKFAKDAEGIR